MSDNQACDNEESTLGVSLLLTAATTTTGSDKYRLIWRRTIGVGILVTVGVKKTLYDQESPQPSPLPYADSEQPQHVIDVHSVDGDENEDPNKLKLIRL